VAAISVAVSVLLAVLFPRRRKGQELTKKSNLFNEESFKKHYDASRNVRRPNSKIISDENIADVLDKGVRELECEKYTLSLLSSCEGITNDEK